MASHIVAAAAGRTTVAARRKVVTLTEAAASRIQQLLEQRLGSSHMAATACHILNNADDKGKFDELVEDKGMKILIDPKALMYVIGTKMDFVDDKLRLASVLIHLGLIETDKNKERLQ